MNPQLKKIIVQCEVTGHQKLVGIFPDTKPQEVFDLFGPGYSALKKKDGDPLGESESLYDYMNDGELVFIKYSY